MGPWIASSSMPTPRRMSRVIANPVVPVLSRSEMAFSGVPDKELTFVRNYARTAFPDDFWTEEDPLVRQRQLFTLLEAYTRAVAERDPVRAGMLTDGIADARANFERSARRLEAKQVRRLPKLPDPLETGATPVDDDEDAATPRHVRDATRDMIERAHKNDRPTQGEEKWDSKWGDPNIEIPHAMPQGMRRLPPSEPVAIPPRQKAGPKTGGAKRGRERSQ